MKGLDGAILVDETDFSDALSLGPAAAGRTAILLTQGTVMPSSTQSFVENLDADARFIIVGSKAAKAANSVWSGIPDTSFIAGEDQYDTAAKISDLWSGQSKTIGLAVGDTFPDALSGGAMMALQGGPLLLTEPDSLSLITENALLRFKDSAADLFVFGDSIATQVSTQAAALLSKLTNCLVPCSSQSYLTGAPMIAGETTLHTDGQFYIQDGGTPPPVSSWDFSNGLVITASVGATIVTGEAYGDIRIRLHAWDTRPPQADDPYGLTDGQSWDDIVEASVLCKEERLAICSMDSDAHLPKLSTCGSGAYRIRVHARGRDTPRIDADGFPHATDEFLIVSWPEPMHSTLPIRMTGRKGA